MRQQPLYRFTPVGLDLWDRRPGQPEPGAVVVKVQPRGCPPNGTMGHCFVAPVGRPANSGVLVLQNSLVRLTRAEVRTYLESHPFGRPSSREKGSS